MFSVYRRLVRKNEVIHLINGNDGTWIRIEVLAIEGSRVHLGFDSSKDLRPRLEENQQIVTDVVRVRATRLQGKQTVQLQLRFSCDFRVLPRSRPHNQGVLAGKRDSGDRSFVDGQKLKNSTRSA